MNNNWLQLTKEEIERLSSIQDSDNGDIKFLATLIQRILFQFWEEENG